MRKENVQVTLPGTGLKVCVCTMYHAHDVHREYLVQYKYLQQQEVTATSRFTDHEPSTIEAIPDTRETRERKKLIKRKKTIAALESSSGCARKYQERDPMQFKFKPCTL
jgi:hypothetical protein